MAVRVCEGSPEPEPPVSRQEPERHGPAAADDDVSDRLDVMADPDPSRLEPEMADDHRRSESQGPGDEPERPGPSLPHFEREVAEFYQGRRRTAQLPIGKMPPVLQLLHTLTLDDEELVALAVVTGAY